MLFLFFFFFLFALNLFFFFFFFQAEDGIRDLYVTGVQTCALPISGCRERPVQPVPALLVVPAQVPEPRQGRRQPQRGGDVRPVTRGLERHAQVVRLGLQPFRGLRLLRPGQLGFRSLGQVQVPGQHCPAGRRVLARFGQALRAVLADGREHPVPAQIGRASCRERV